MYSQTNFPCPQVLLFLCLSSYSCSPLSLADGNAEPINAMDGFYGNPLYRQVDGTIFISLLKFSISDLMDLAPGGMGHQAMG